MTNEKWELGTISDIAEISPRINKSHLTDDSLVSFISMTSVSESGGVIEMQEKRYADVKSGFSSFENGDVLFAKITPCMENGKGALVDNLTNGVGFGSTEFFVLRAKQPESREFLYQLTISKDFREKARSYMKGTSGQQRVSKDIFSMLKIPVPPLPEQQRIASILSAADKAIEEAGIAVEESERMKKGLMQKLIPNDETNIEKWDSVRLDEISDVQTGPFGSQLHQKDYVEDGSPIITVEHLGEYGITNQNLPRVSDTDKERLSRFILRKGDIVFSRVGSVDRNCLITDEEDGWLFSGRLLRIRPTKLDKVNAKYLSYFFHTHEFVEMIKNHSVGGIMPSLNTKLMSDVKIILPPLMLQEKISEVISRVDERILLAKKRKALLEKTKLGLMQKLLS